LRLTQTQFGELGGVKRVSQHLYEAGDRVPDVNYLIRLKDHGVDVSHLLGVGGHRNGSANYADAHIYLSVFRAVDEFARDATGAPFSSAERERFFSFLCAAISQTDSSPSEAELQNRLARFMRP